MKIFFGILFGLILIVNTTFAMTFSQPVEIGGIGFPVQSPYRYYLVEGATFNSGKPYEESPKFARACWQSLNLNHYGSENNEIQKTI